MNNFLDDCVAGISGVIGGGGTLIAVNSKAIDNLEKFLIFTLSSIFAGFLGVAGKYLFVYIRKKTLHLCANLSKKPSVKGERLPPRG